ncbi:hypothetical protein Q3G72_012388 [Acer saccharum]|nr:hypothetical protein Q3G72_012388 [Acer saccharum]
MSIALYARMHRQNGVVPDKHTFPLLLKAFSKSRNQNPFQLYAHIVKYGFDSDDFVRNSFISAFSNCGYVNFARQLFNDTTQRDVVAWTAMIDGYVKNGCAVDGLRCFMEMISVGVRIDAMTIVSVLVAAGMVGDVWFGSGRYTLLANLYSKSERWDGDAQVRKIMRRKGVDKTPGCSWIQVNGVVSEFISHDTSHSKLTKHIYEMLNYINVELKLIGYVSDKDFLAFDLDVV